MAMKMLGIQEIMLCLIFDIPVAMPRLVLDIA
jgi:hypothetical protein